jgi:chromosome segregation ATPase
MRTPEKIGALYLVVGSPAHEAAVDAREAAPRELAELREVVKRLEAKLTAARAEIDELRGRLDYAEGQRDSARNDVAELTATVERQQKLIDDVAELTKVVERQQKLIDDKRPMVN